MPGEAQKRNALKLLRDGGAEGVVFKDRNARYSAVRPIDLDHMCGHLLGSVSTGNGVVRTTYNGICGDAGWHSDLGLVVSDSATTRRRVKQLGSLYEATLGSRQVVFQALSPTLSHGAAAGIGAGMGLDNRRLLPPFVPGFDNEDGAFAHFLALLDEEAFIGHVPYTIFHEPPSVRVYAEHRDAMLRIADYIAGALSLWRPTPGRHSFAQRLESAGRHLQYLASLPRDGFSELMHTTACSRTSQFIQICDGALEHDSFQPQNWEADLRQRIHAMRSHAGSPSCLVPSDLVLRGGEDVCDSVRRIVGRVGDLLVYWPAIVARTKALKEAGTDIACKV